MRLIVRAPVARANRRKPFFTPGLGLASAVPGTRAPRASATSPSTRALLTREKQCIAASWIGSAGPPAGPDTGTDRPPSVRRLEVQLEADPHPAGLAGKVVGAPDSVVERVRHPALLRRGVDVIPIPETLLGADEIDAVRRP